ncbi:survival protein sure-like phosphatase/nucleotidase [Lasiosphaeria miniovina]|uniref:Survival protein sure-like phosphatase/nucleotidase n=1 Tax=Lasiosphaeria miniovina TaxID=1954250 RepID=A0AA40ACQ4_9PEZI|nr:survival protein sure-like phosphatase/nucleotidase [Lasiosphaeria miniovina]KAK0713417.1 survival protein sure-like phosphatase/nucleotidase [Lasiosphaeria miniovina]
MRNLSLLKVGVAFAAAVQGLNVLITNDDGFGTANIRELYKQMTDLGHSCYLVASATFDVGSGTRLDFTNSPKMTRNGDWDLVKSGAPSIGPDPDDGHIWYYNGTPAAQVVVALDYILPTFTKVKTPDLVISGPNSGWNVGPFLYTTSGAIGATYMAIERGIPAVAFFSGNTVPTPYFWVNASTKAGLQDPATITARLASTLVQALIDKAAGSRILPQGYGLTVNLPYITSYTNEQCTNPPFVLTRMGGNAEAKAVFNSKTGLFNRSRDSGSDDSHCANGNCKIPAEKDVLNSGCMSSVTVFAVDYSAPYKWECFNISDVTALVPVIVQLNGSTPLVGGLGPNASVVGNVSLPPTPSPGSTPPPMTTISSIGVRAQWSLSVLMASLGVLAFLF